MYKAESFDEFKKECIDIALKSTDKICKDFKAFSVMCDGYTPIELAVMIGSLFKKTSSDPQRSYDSFLFVLKKFMKKVKLSDD
jgi:hypothetical protein